MPYRISWVNGTCKPFGTRTVYKVMSYMSYHCAPITNNTAAFWIDYKFPDGKVHCCNPTER